MPKKRTVTALITLWVIAANVNVHNWKTTRADKEAVEDALHSLNAHATVNDIVKIHSVTTPAFYGFDGDHPYSNIDDLMKVVKTQQDLDVKFVWNVTLLRFTTYPNDARITYPDNGPFQLPDSITPAPAVWLESSVLEKQDGT